MGMDEDIQLFSLILYIYGFSGRGNMRVDISQGDSLSAKHGLNYLIVRAFLLPLFFIPPVIPPIIFLIQITRDAEVSGY
jgi:hypothetical protein